MAAGDHVINNKKVDPKKAKARHGKIFVGGLSTELSDDDIKNFFSQSGTVNILIFSIIKIIYSLEYKNIMKLNICCRLLKWKCHLTRQRTKGKDFASLLLNLNK